MSAGPARPGPRLPWLARALAYYRTAGRLWFRWNPREVLRPRTRPLGGPRILLVLLGRLGDVVLASAVIGAARMAYPGARISFATSWTYADIVRRDPRVDEVICCERPDQAQALSRVGRFDIAASLAIQDPEWWKRGHLIRHYASLGGRGLGVEIQDLASPVHVSVADRSRVAKVLERRGVRPGARLLAVHPSTARLKMWPLDRWRRLIEILREARPDHQIVVLGAKGEPSIPGDLPGVHPLHGLLMLPEVAALIEISAAFAGPVSGLMHIADSLGVPSVVLFGSEIPAWGGPYQARCVLVQAPTTCEPACCYPCHQPRFCIDDIQVETVHAGIEALLDGGGQIPELPEGDLD